MKSVNGKETSPRPPSPPPLFLRDCKSKEICTRTVHEITSPSKSVGCLPSVSVSSLSVGDYLIQPTDRLRETRIEAASWLSQRQTTYHHRAKSGYFFIQLLLRGKKRSTTTRQVQQFGTFATSWPITESITNIETRRRTDRTAWHSSD